MEAAIGSSMNMCHSLLTAVLPAPARTGPEREPHSRTLPGLGIPAACKREITLMRGHTQEPAAIPGGEALPFCCTEPCLGLQGHEATCGHQVHGRSCGEPRSFALRVLLLCW